MDGNQGQTQVSTKSNIQTDGGEIGHGVVKGLVEKGGACTARCACRHTLPGRGRVRDQRRSQNRQRA